MLAVWETNMSKTERLRGKDEDFKMTNTLRPACPIPSDAILRREMEARLVCSYHKERDATLCGLFSVGRGCGPCL